MGSNPTLSANFIYSALFRMSPFVTVRYVSRFMIAPQDQNRPQTSTSVARSDDDAALQNVLRFLVHAIIGFAGAALLIAGGLYLWRFRGGLTSDHSRWGEFGDFLGGTLNPILAVLGLVALLATIIIQSRELRNSTRELKHSVVVLGEQSASLKIQNFERTFFEMVRLHHDIVRDMDLGVSVDRQRTEGRDCFRIFFRRLNNSHPGRRSEGSDEEKLAVAIGAYGRFYESNEHEVGHYFRNFYRILKFVDESEVVNKEEYSGILRAQLSSFELALLFYNSLHPIGAKLKPLVERYSMLENLNLDLLCDTEGEVRLYGASAYGEQDVTRYY